MTNEGLGNACRLLLLPTIDNITNWRVVPVKLPIRMLKKLLHEPLAHFSLAGGLIFLLYALFGPDDASEREIVIDKGVIERLKSAWQLRANREPAPEELDGLVADYLFEEVFSREARALGLEQDDPVIRRRLAQKITLLAESAAQQVEPKEAELRAWYGAHPELYRTEPRLGFSHIYFSHDRPGGSAEEDAAALLPRLEGSGASAGQDMGDAFMLPREFTDIGRSQLGRLFGEEFASTLFTLRTGSWQGPVRSGYGFHLAYLYELQDAEPIPFDESRPRVLQDWQRDRFKQTEKDLLEQLKSRYEIIYTQEAQAHLGPE